MGTREAEENEWSIEEVPCWPMKVGIEGSEQRLTWYKSNSSDNSEYSYEGIWILKSPASRIGRERDLHRSRT